MNCKNCGTKIAEGEQFCSSCGAEIGASSFAADEKEKSLKNDEPLNVSFSMNMFEGSTDSAADRAALNICPFCGTPLGEGAAFCTFCGANVGVAPSSNVLSGFAANVRLVKDENDDDENDDEPDAQDEPLTSVPPEPPAVRRASTRTFACPSCGATLEMGVSFCGSCGRRFIYPGQAPKAPSLKTGARPSAVRSSRHAKPKTVSKKSIGILVSIFVVALLVVGAVAGYFLYVNSDSYKLNSADKLIESGNLNEALSVLRTVGSSTDNRKIRIAEKMIEGGRFDEALEILDGIESGTDEQKMKIADCLIDAGKPEEALKVLDGVGSGAEDQKVRIAVNYIEEGKYDEAANLVRGIDTAASAALESFIDLEKAKKEMLRSFNSHGDGSNIEAIGGFSERVRSFIEMPSFVMLPKAMQDEVNFIRSSLNFSDAFLSNGNGSENMKDLFCAVQSVFLDNVEYRHSSEGGSGYTFFEFKKRSDASRKALASLNELQQGRVTINDETLMNFLPDSFPKDDDGKCFVGLGSEFSGLVSTLLETSRVEIEIIDDWVGRHKNDMNTRYYCEDPDLNYGYFISNDFETIFSNENIENNADMLNDLMARDIVFGLLEGKAFN